MAKKKNTHTVLVPFGVHEKGDEVYFTDKFAKERFEALGYVKAITMQKPEERDTKELKNTPETK